MGRVQKPAGTSRDCHYVDMKIFYSRLSIFIVHFVLVVARCGLAAGEIETSWYFWLGMAFVDFVPSSTITFTVTTNHDYLDSVPVRRTQQYFHKDNNNNNPPSVSKALSTLLVLYYGIGGFSEAPCFRTFIWAVRQVVTTR